MLTSDLRDESGQVTDVLISIDLMDLSVRTALSPEHGGGRSPAWAADGGRFAFIRSADAGEELWLATDAVVRTLGLMGGRFGVMGRVMRLLPRPLRDAAYRFVARRRRAWFGRVESCPLPASEQRPDAVLD